MLLALVCTVGVGARAFRLGTPGPQNGQGGTVFDESYYVNAARVIAGVHMNPNDRYYGAAPSGADPNAEHPQLAKMLIAASIRIGGDTPIAWRITAVLFSLAALLALYFLVRSAGGSPWLALGATTIASLENLWLVSGRIAVLDIYCVPFMLMGAAFYLRRHPVVAGVWVGVGAALRRSRSSPCSSCSRSRRCGRWRGLRPTARRCPRNGPGRRGRTGARGCGPAGAG